MSSTSGEQQRTLPYPYRVWRIWHGTDTRIPVVCVCRSNAPYMWHKENLVVQAVRRLPPRITKVVSLDKDVWFSDENWLKKLDAALDEADFVQPFEHICMQSPEYSFCLPTRYSVSKAAGFLAGCDVKVKPCGHPGLAVGVRRDIVQQLGLMERSIIGSGDQLLWNAVFNNIVPPAPKHIDKLIAQAGIGYTEFRLAVPRLLGHPPRVAFLSNITATHAYHGSPLNKQHVERILMLVDNNFTVHDYYLNDDNMWAVRDTARWQPIFNRYFNGRHEDGIDAQDLKEGAAGTEVQ
jgi:hypothetical protein